MSSVRPSRERRRTIRKRARTAIELWHRHEDRSAKRQARRLDAAQFGHADGDLAPVPPGEVVASIPRRKPLLGGRPPEGDRRPSMVKRVAFPTTLPRTLLRLFLWCFGLARFLALILKDAIRRKATPQSRAVRLREAFESLGASFIKFGQQLSIRADMIPYVYCEELGKMLDRVPPFPVEQAIETIERSTGKKLGEIFSRFDPTPIGSASLACVYQAYLHDSGARVAVKVRRPGIGETFAADMRALGWLVMVFEFLTIMKPGILESLLRELKTMLMQELDFRREARFTDIFRRRAKKENIPITAPRVHFEFSNDEVLISEFVSGIWMWELVSAVDRDDRAALAEISSRGIDPKIVARRLTRAIHWESLENIFFHADPHPANMVVQPGNVICFIDFGACGRFSSKVRHHWKQMHYHMLNEDVNKMAHSALGFAEPLPPIDVEKFTREVESLYWDWMYATKSKDAEWWEKSTGQCWIAYASIARNYGVPINIETLQVFRATLLYDSIIFRLWKGIDFPAEYRKYAGEAGGRAKKKVQKGVRKRVFGLDKRDYLTIEEFRSMSNNAVHRVQRLLDTPIPNFSSMVSKAAYGVVSALRMLAIAAAATCFVLLVLAGSRLVRNEPIDIIQLAKQMAANPSYQVVWILGILLVIRRIVLRLEDVDVAK